MASREKYHTVGTRQARALRSDRFVRARASLDELRRRPPPTDINPTTETWDIKYLTQKKYKSYFDKALGLTPKPEKVYHPPPWPCVPRLGNHLSASESILDLPTYSYAIFPHILDWSNDNVLVAALGRRYYKWSESTQKLISSGICENTIHCCKFEPTGNLLALGTDRKTVEMHDRAHICAISSNVCHEEDDCIRTTIDWSPTGKAFATGCTGGVVAACDRSNIFIRWKRVTDHPILSVRVSPDARYVAVAATNSPSVLILSWPTLDLYSNVESAWKVLSIAWHPWRTALLGIGAVTDQMKATVCVWDTPPRRTGGAVVVSKHPCCIDAMLFSHRTGELVLGLYGKVRGQQAASRYYSNLVVMCDGTTVVDRWESNKADLDRIRTMVFSPDGTKLATATSNEDLIIYNFLPEDKTNSPKKNKKFHALAVYLDEDRFNGFSFR